MTLVQLAWFEFVGILIFGVFLVSGWFARQEANKLADIYRMRWLATVKEQETELIKRMRAERLIRELQERLNTFAKVYLEEVRPPS